MVKPTRKKFHHSSSKEAKFIAYCEEYYFFHSKGFPTAEQAAVALNYSITDIQFFLRNKLVQEALDRRGLPWKTSGHTNSAELTPTQVAVAIAVTNFADPRPPDQKLDDLGILPDQYRAWLNDPTFHAFVNQLADRNLDNVRPDAITEFTKLVRQGDLAAIKYYFEITGQFKQQSVTNIQALIQKLIEAVQRHVKDPQILAAIAQEILATAPTIAENVTIDVKEITPTYSETEEQAIRSFVGGR